MTVPRSEYLSKVWAEGIFGKSTKLWPLQSYRLS